MTKTLKFFILMFFLVGCEDQTNNYTATKKEISSYCSTISSNDSFELKDTSTFNFFKNKVKKEDLIDLTNHPNQIVRFASFLAFLQRNEANFFQLLLNHVKDTSKITLNYIHYSFHSTMFEALAKVSFPYLNKEQKDSLIKNGYFSEEQLKLLHINSWTMYDEDMDCEQCLNQAIIDRQNGILAIYMYGDRRSTKMYDSILTKDYNIFVINRSCFASKGWDCYNDYMYQEIKNHFKNDILSDAFEKAEILEFEKLTKKKFNTISCVDFSDAYQYEFFNRFIEFDTASFKALHEKRLSELLTELKKIESLIARKYDTRELLIKYDTLGYPIDIINPEISSNLKTQYINELKKIGKFAVFKINGEKKELIYPNTISKIKK